MSTSAVKHLPRRYVPSTVLKHLEKVGEKHKLRKGYSLYQCLSRLPGQGVGMRIYKRRWEQDGLLTNAKMGTYWHVVRTAFSTREKDPERHAWGIKYINGVQVTPPHTIVQIEDPDDLWLPCDDMPPGRSSRSFYLSGQLRSMEGPEYGTDPATASVQDEPPAAMPVLGRTTDL